MPPGGIYARRKAAPLRGADAGPSFDGCERGRRISGRDRQRSGIALKVETDSIGVGGNVTDILQPELRIEGINALTEHAIENAVRPG
jgi:hypothetical protein